jgi:flavin reductase (DIM6/NTAB) family NADH-FMN oxidoreductase RutF
MNQEMSAGRAVSLGSEAAERGSALVDLAQYRRTVGAFLTGVTVITVLDSESRPRGITANSFTSVSLDPPMVLFCVAKTAASYEAFVESQAFVIHILGSGQQDLAQTFASKSPQKFKGLLYRQSSTRAPIIDDVHAWLECSTETITVAGDHAIVVGRVNDFASREQRPLGFYQGKFQSFDTESEMSLLPKYQGATIAVGWVLEATDGRVALHVDDNGSVGIPKTRLPTSNVSEEGLTSAASNQLGVTAGIDFLYSVYSTEDEGMTLIYRGRTEPDEKKLQANKILLVATDDVPWDSISDSSEKAVLDRYARERVEARFGIYAGTRSDGSIATVGGVSPDRRNPFRKGATARRQEESATSKNPSH